MMMRNVRQAVWVAASLVALAGCSHAGKTATSPQARPAPTSPSAASLAPAQTPQPVASKPAQTAPQNPVPSGSPGTGATSTPAPLVVKRVPRLPPNAAPKILDVAVSETTVRPGDRVLGQVVTTSNVASVEARIGGYAVTLDKVGVGRFQLRYTVGPLPWFVHGSFTMQVIARNPRGDTDTRAIALTVR